MTAASQYTKEINGMEAELRIELRYSDLQSGALPLCYSAFIVGKTTGV
jgi:hypothetical protein